MSIYNAESSRPGATGGKKLSNVIIVLTIFLSFLPSCDYYARPRPDGGLPDSYPYSPEKANAEIISSYDMSAYFEIDDNVNFAFSDTARYFVCNEKVLVFDSTFKKPYEFMIDVETIVDVSPNTLEKKYFYDMTAFDNVLLLSYMLSTSGPRKYSVIELNLDTSVWREVNFVDFSTDDLNLFLGYNIGTNQVWLHGKEVTETEYKYYMYDYDLASGEYSFKSSIPDTSWTPYDISIYKNYLWKVFFLGHPTGKTNIYKRTLIDQETSLHTIHVNYLGTTTDPVTMIPNDIMWYKDHLWILLPKDGKKMLLEVNPL